MSTKTANRFMALAQFVDRFHLGPELLNQLMGLELNTL